MRITINHKLSGLVAALALVAVGVAGFAVYQLGLARDRAEDTDRAWNDASSPARSARRSSTRS